MKGEADFRLFMKWPLEERDQYAVLGRDIRIRPSSACF